MAHNKRYLAILFVTLVIVMLGFGMILPILPFYIERFQAGGLQIGLLMTTFTVMQFLFAPIWGLLSDHLGRKPLLVVGVLGTAISQLFFGLSSQLWMLYASRALAGILSAATLPAAMAYVGDSTAEEERGGGMGILGAATGVGMLLGPGLGSWLAERSLPLPFFVAAGLSMLMLPFILLVLPESLPAGPRETAEEGLQVPQVGELWGALFAPVGLLLLLSFLLSFGLTNFEGVFGLYAWERYGYDPARVGSILVIIGLTSALAQGALTGPLTRRWGEAAIIRASLAASAVGFVLMLLAIDYAGVLVTTNLFVLGNALLRPSVSSLISRQAAGNQGLAMGLNNSFMSLGRILGPLWAGTLFDLNLSLPYLSGAAVMAAGFALSLFFFKGKTPAGPEPGNEAEILA